MRGRPICRHCYCPLLLLRLESGKEEQRRVCSQCQEARALKAPTEKQARKKAQVKAWKAANKDQVRATEKAWKEANKQAPGMQRSKLLIENLRLVKDAAASHYARKARSKHDT